MAEDIVSTALLFLGVVLGPAMFLLSIVVYCVNRVIAQIREYKEQRYLRSLPCSHCHYFSNGEFLQCAVNPQQVLTEASKQCFDFARIETAGSFNEHGSCLRIVPKQKITLKK